MRAKDLAKGASSTLTIAAVTYFVLNWSTLFVIIYKAEVWKGNFAVGDLSLGAPPGYAHVLCIKRPWRKKRYSRRRQI